MSRPAAAPALSPGMVGPPPQKLSTPPDSAPNRRYSLSRFHASAPARLFFGDEMTRVGEKRPGPRKQGDRPAQRNGDILLDRPVDLIGHVLRPVQHARPGGYGWTIHDSRQDMLEVIHPI